MGGALLGKGGVILTCRVRCHRKGSHRGSPPIPPAIRFVCFFLVINDFFLMDFFTHKKTCLSLGVFCMPAWMSWKFPFFSWGSSPVPPSIRTLRREGACFFLSWRIFMIFVFFFTRKKKDTHVTIWFFKTSRMPCGICLLSAVKAPRRSLQWERDHGCSLG